MDRTPHGLFEVQGHFFHSRLVRQDRQDCLEDHFVITFLPPRHADEHEGNLLYMVIVFYECVYRQQLREGVAAQFKDGIQVPCFRFGEDFQLPVGCED